MNIVHQFSYDILEPQRRLKHPSISRYIFWVLGFTLIIILSFHPIKALSMGQTLETITNTPTIIQPTEMALTETQTITTTSTESVTPSATHTPTLTLTSTITPKSTNTTTSTPSKTPTPTLQAFYIPIIFYLFGPTPIPTPTLTPTPVSTPTTLLYCAAPYIGIPDNNPSGVSSTFNIPDPRIILDIDLRLNINHTWVGDLIVKLTHQETGKSTILLDRPGYPTTKWGCEYDNIGSILNDELTLPVENQCYNNPYNASLPTISGIYVPNNPLSIYDTDSAVGHWQLNVSDNFQNDSGTLNEWCLAVTVNNYYIAPTPTPVIGPLPDQAFVYGVTGKSQALPLDCEIRSAVDWAKFFGRSIDELEFFYKLPVSDDPDAGFVGNVYGQWGQIPPNPYGVHASPVANLLNNYGVLAYPRKLLDWNLLRIEIASGYPVITWIIGDHTNPSEHMLENSIPIYYTANNGHMSIVASYEHTVIVTGYSTTSVNYLDGATIYSIALDQFLSSWSALGNMAITYQP